MENLLLLPLGCVAAFIVAACLYAALLYARMAIWYGQESLDSWSERLRDRTSQAAYELERKARKREFVKWLRARIGAGATGGAVDPGVVEAHRQTPVLRRLVEVEIPEATLRCAKVHRLTANAAGAGFIRDVAYEPECYALRERVVDLEEATIEMLGTYQFVLDDDALLHNLVVLRKRILPTCRECPYLNHAVGPAPPLCPSAEAARIEPTIGGCHAREPRTRK
jgi:hypothetical protein